MTRTLPLLAATLLAALTAGGCDDKSSAKAPPPQEVSDNSIADFCNMALAEHPGPKGQIFVKGEPRPHWFASVHDVFAFVMLPDTPKAVTAIYVNDMGKAKIWEQPEAGPWIDAHKALYVIDSRKRGGMGEDEAVPFSDRDAAQHFIAENGGRLVAFNDVPRDYILPNGDVPPTEAGPAPQNAAAPNEATPDTSPPAMSNMPGMSHGQETNHDHHDMH